ncbi:hypothetical protein Tco_0228214 [Tanacetum coccineum]
MIQPEPEVSTQGYPLDSVEVLRFVAIRVFANPNSLKTERRVLDFAATIMITVAAWNSDGKPVYEVYLEGSWFEIGNLIDAITRYKEAHGSRSSSYLSNITVCKGLWKGLKGLEVGSIRRIQGIGYGVLEFLGVGTTFDIFQNIHILYLQYDVLTSSRYGVLIFFPLWSLVSADMDTPYLP